MQQRAKQASQRMARMSRRVSWTESGDAAELLEQYRHGRVAAGGCGWHGTPNSEAMEFVIDNSTKLHFITLLTATAISELHFEISTFCKASDLSHSGQSQCEAGVNTIPGLGCLHSETGRLVKAQQVRNLCFASTPSFRPRDCFNFKALFKSGEEISGRNLLLTKSN